MTTLAFTLLCILLLAAATAVLFERDSIRGALGAALSFVTIGLFFIALGAEFLGLVQFIVYVGAVAILIVFVILLTPMSAVSLPRLSPTAMGGLMTAGAVLVGLWVAILQSPSLAGDPLADPPEAIIEMIGERLLSTHLLPLQAVAVLLTAALIGAALFVWDDKLPSSTKPSSTEK